MSGGVTWSASVAMLAAGIGIPVMAALNSGLGVRIESPQTAAALLFTLALAISVVAVAFTGMPERSALSEVPWPYFAGGAFVAFYVLSITWVAPHIGVGNAVFLVLLGQLVSAALIDHFGAFGAAQSSLTGTRLLGLALIAAGIYLARKPA